MNGYSCTRYGNRKFDSFYSQMDADPLQAIIEREINRFFSVQGRRPRVLISRPAQELSGGCMNQVTPRQAATRFAGCGFDVDISPDHVTAGQIAKMALDNDVHLVCLLFDGKPAGNFQDSLSEELKKLSCSDVEVVFCHSNPAGASDEDRTAGNKDRPEIAPRKADILQVLKKLTGSFCQ